MRGRLVLMVLTLLGGLGLALGATAPAGAGAGANMVAERWSVTVDGASSVTEPVVGAGRVYVGFATAAGGGGVRALDLATGTTLWTRSLPLPVAVAPAFAPGPARLYVATDARLYALDPANGTTIVGAPASEFDARTYTLHFADGRLYLQTVQDLTALTPDLAVVWRFDFEDDSTPLDAPGDGFLYVNDEGQFQGGFPQCLKKFDGATGAQAARNCEVDDFIAPTAVPARNVVVGAGDAGVYGWRAGNLRERWLNTRYAGYYANNATEASGGRVAVALGQRFALLRTSDGSRVCEQRLGGRDLGTTQPAFQPGSAASYLLDTAADQVIKVSGSCKELWSYAAGVDVVGFATSSSRLIGAGGSTVFSLDL